MSSVNESKLFPWSSRISLVPFKTFRGPLFSKPVTGQELFFAVSYSKPALVTLELWLPDKYSFVVFLLWQKTNLTIFKEIVSL